MSHRLRTDVSHLVSWTLLASAAATIVTGIIADAWDLNGFRTHTVAGYIMTVAALAHVALTWRRLTFYARFRSAHLRRWLRGIAATGARRVGLVPVTATSAEHSAPTAGGPAARTDGSATRARGSAGSGARVDTAPRASAARTARPSTVRGAALTRRGLLGVVAGGAVGFLGGRGLRPPPAIPEGSDVGIVYHEWSKPGVVDALGTLADWGRQPPQYKTYDGARFVALPAVVPRDGPSVHDAIHRRRSTRGFAGVPLPTAALSTLLRQAGGLRGGADDRRTAPSSGALYPIEVYAVVNGVDGLDPGVYHYDVRRHGLSLVRDGEWGSTIMRHGLDQDFLASANVVFVLTMIMQRMRFKYRDRTYRYGLLEAGHVGQNIYLSACGLDLGACAVGAFDDDGVNDLLGVDGRDEVAVYLLAAGVPA